MATKERVAIVGSGLIGRAWAVVFASGGCEVALYDAGKGVAVKAKTLVADALADLAAKGLVKGGKKAAATAAARVRAASSLADALDDASYVQESTPETLENKLAIFAEMDRLTFTDTILASSTSTIVASKYTEKLKGRHRCLVAHPVNPPHLVPLVELVGAPWTDPKVIARAKRLYGQVGQVPIVVKKEIDGFILNRLQAVLLAEAFRLVEGGYVTPQDCDKTLKDGLGLRWSFMGPFETIELNAPGGIPDYCARYGGPLSALALADPAIFRSPAADLVMAQWKALAPAAVAKKMRWRDKRLVALKAHKRAQPEK